MFNLTSSTIVHLVGTVVPSPAVWEKLQPTTMDNLNLLYMYEKILSNLTWSMLSNLLLIGLLLINIKSVPFVYHLRLLNGLRHVCASQRSPKPLTPAQLFQPIITSSHASLMEIDVLGHKNNSTYFSDMDIARVHLVTTLFSKAIEKIRGGTTMNNVFSGKPSSKLNLALGAVSCSFKRELKPYETYDMWTRSKLTAAFGRDLTRVTNLLLVLSWDKKWIYIVTHFVKKGAKIEPKEFTLYPKQISRSGSHQSSLTGTEATNTPRGSISGKDGATQSRSPIAASALSKVVFKDGRTTVSPEFMLQAAGLLPATFSSNKPDQSPRLVAAQIEANIEDVSPNEAVSELSKVAGYDSESESSLRSSMDGLESNWTRETIEAERLRGMRMASLLGQQVELENEFDDSVCLGRHYDGLGIEGVVATLAQLGKLSNYQLI